MRKSGLTTIAVCTFLCASVLLRADDSGSSSGKAKFPHVRLGGISIGAGYSNFSGPFWDPYWAGAWPAYDPFFNSPYFYAPYFAPGYFYNYAYQPGYGELKLKSVSKTATVFIDGAYAGSAGKLKEIWLEPGVYQFQIQDAGQTRERKVYILSGKTLRLSEQDMSKSVD